jgi:dTDP-4-amino-4,6-dideoxygalactose transaminase
LIDRRKRVWKGYHERLQPLAASGRVSLPFIPDYAEHNGHIYYVLAPNREARDTAFAKMHAEGVNALSHYVPLHQAPAATRYARSSGALAQTEDIADRLIRLPMFADLESDEIDRVVEVLETSLP